MCHLYCDMFCFDVATVLSVVLCFCCVVSCCVALCVVKRLHNRKKKMRLSVGEPLDVIPQQLAFVARGSLRPGDRAGTKGNVTDA